MAVFTTVQQLKDDSSLIASSDVPDDELLRTLNSAERDLENHVLLETYTAEDVASFDPDRQASLRLAATAQTEYRLHMGPAFFIEGGLISGGDLTVERTPPKIAPNALDELRRGGFIRLTGRMSATTQVPSLQKRFS